MQGHARGTKEHIGTLMINHIGITGATKSHNDYINYILLLYSCIIEKRLKDMTPASYDQPAHRYKKKDSPPGFYLASPGWT